MVVAIYQIATARKRHIDIATAHSTLHCCPEQALLVSSCRIKVPWLISDVVVWAHSSRRLFHAVVLGREHTSLTTITCIDFRHKHPGKVRASACQRYTWFKRVESVGSIARLQSPQQKWSADSRLIVVGWICLGREYHVCF